MYTIKENEKIKVMCSPDVNYIFNKVTGLAVTWGSTEDEDPTWCPYGPLIVDIEITTKCGGPGGKPCPFCYKSNTPTNGDNMSLETFKKVFDKLPHKDVIEIEIDDGYVVKLDPNDIVNTSSGPKKASDITENDDLYLSL